MTSCPLSRTFRVVPSFRFHSISMGSTGPCWSGWPRRLPIFGRVLGPALGAKRLDGIRALVLVICLPTFPAHPVAWAFMFSRTPRVLRLDYWSARHHYAAECSRSLHSRQWRAQGT